MEGSISPINTWRDIDERIALAFGRMDLLKRQFQPHKAERLVKQLRGPEYKSYWPNRVKDLVNLSKSLYSSEIPLTDPKNIGPAFRRLVRLLPITTYQAYRENMIEWRKRRGGNKK